MSITKLMTGSEPGGVPTAPYGGDIDKLVKEWAQNTANKLLAASRKKNYNFENFTWQVNEGANPGITFTFPVHGAYMDMKMLFWTSMPNLDAIEKWVKSKPASFWAYVPGYAGRSGIGDVPLETAQKRIAFGVARSMASGEPRNNWAKYKRQRIWQQPNVGKSVAYLANLLAEELAAISSDAVIKPLIQD
jgi:hypothetical protein